LLLCKKVVFSSPCQRQRELLPSLGVRRPSLQGCSLPSFDSFGLAVSEKIFLEINPSETKMACGAYVCKWIGTK
jgi:hypothetical protein